MKFFTFILTIFLISACQPAPESASTSTEETNDPATETFERNIETTKKMFAAFMNKDLDLMKTFITDDFAWMPPQLIADSLDVAGWEEAMTGFMTNYKDIQYTDDLYFMSLDNEQKPNGNVRTYGVWRSTYIPNDKPAAIKYYSVLQFNEQGKLRRQMEWYDSAGLTPED